jgi:hypothetical protein
MTGGWRSVTGLLLAAAAFGAVVRSSDASLVGRIGGVSAALFLIVVGVAAWRGQRWASGASFLLAVCWGWAALALLIQDVIGGAEAAIWLVWSGVVITASIVGRAERAPGPRFPPMRTAVGEDEGDGA